MISRQMVMRQRKKHAAGFIIIAMALARQSAFSAMHVSQAPAVGACTRTLTGSSRRYNLPGRCSQKMAGSTEAETPPSAQLSSVSQSVVNLVKNIVGAGILSLPSGVAAFSGSPEALTPAFILVLAFGLVSAYGFVLVGDACSWTKASTYQDAWARTVSPSSKWMPSLACLANAAIGCICYSMILGDCLSLILQPLGLPSILASRSSSLLLLTAGVLLPLCSMKSLAPLAKFAALGVLSNVYICLFVVLRFFDGSYRIGGTFWSAAPLAPKFVRLSGSAWSAALTPSVTILLSLLGTAFLAHYNAALFYDQLAPAPGGDKAGRFQRVAFLGFAASGLILSVVMIGGFLTFGASSSGLILNNYASTDPLAASARAAIGLSIVTAYPIVFLSIREQFVEFLGKRGAALQNNRPNVVTVGLLGSVTALALSLNDLGKVAGFAGAVFGIFLIYIAPPLMALRARQRGIGSHAKGARGMASIIAQTLLIPLGSALALMGVVQTLG